MNNIANFAQPLPRTAVALPARGGLPDAPKPMITKYLAIALRWKWVILGSIAACLALGMLITFLMTRQYTAVTTIEISRETDLVVKIQGVEREASTADLEFYQTQYGLLQSRSLAERVATELKLPQSDQFFEMFGEASKLRTAKTRTAADERLFRTRLAGDILLRHINIEPMRLSRLVNISFTSPDAALSANVVNTWSKNFIRSNLERRFEATSYARKFLENRLESLRTKLEESERQLVAYASNQKIINVPVETVQGQATTAERPLVATDLSALNTELSDAIADRIKAQSRLERATSGGAGSSTEALQNTAIASLRERRAELAAEYQKLMTQFEPDYPKAKALASQVAQLDSSIAREEARVIGSFRTAYQQALAREQALNHKVNNLKSDLLDLRRRSIQYNIYQRDVDTNRELYNGLLQRYKEIGVAGGVGTNNISIVDAAEVPTRPSSPRLLLNLLLSVVAGSLIGCGLAFILEQSDEAIIDPREVENELGTPLLGTIPKLTEGTPVAAMQDRKSELVEAYLSVQTSLEFSTEHGVPRSITVTSTRPSEGKSTTAFALATSLVRSGRKVVLVDGDMRSPSVHGILGLSNDVGLSNFLAGNDEIEKLIVPVPQFGLHAIPAGPNPPNAAELLTSDRLGRMIEQLLSRYDHVVIDSPPVMGLADAPLIASRVEAALFAVESHGTRASMVRVALGRLLASNVRIAGVVLTKFEPRKSGLTYGYDYGYGYGRKEREASAAL